MFLDSNFVWLEGKWWKETITKYKKTHWNGIKREELGHDRDMSADWRSQGCPPSNVAWGHHWVLTLRDRILFVLDLLFFYPSVFCLTSTKDKRSLSSVRSSTQRDFQDWNLCGVSGIVLRFVSSHPALFLLPCLGATRWCWVTYKDRERKKRNKKVTSKRWNVCVTKRKEKERSRILKQGAGKTFFCLQVKETPEAEKKIRIETVAVEYVIV